MGASVSRGQQRRPACCSLVGAYPGFWALRGLCFVGSAVSTYLPRAPRAALAPACNERDSRALGAALLAQSARGRFSHKATVYAPGPRLQPARPLPLLERRPQQHICMWKAAENERCRCKPNGRWLRA